MAIDRDELAPGGFPVSQALINAREQRLKQSGLSREDMGICEICRLPVDKKKCQWAWFDAGSWQFLHPDEVDQYPEASLAAIGRECAKKFRGDFAEYLVKRGSVKEEHEPQSGTVVYHGTHDDISVLKERPATTVDKIGTWFTENPEFAIKYGSKAYKFILPPNMKFYRYAGSGSKDDFWAAWFSSEIALREFKQVGRSFLRRLLDGSLHAADDRTLYRAMREAFEAAKTGKTYREWSPSELKRVVGKTVLSRSWDEFIKENMIWNPSYLKEFRGSLEAEWYDGVLLDGLSLDFPGQDKVWIVFNPSGMKPVGEPQMEAARRKKKRRRMMPPFFGPVGGPSGATLPAFRPSLQSPPGSSVSSPALPGAGGINAPGVAGGANAGTGPVMASIEPNGYWFSPAALMDDVQLIAQIGAEDE